MGLVEGVKAKAFNYAFTAVCLAGKGVYHRLKLLKHEASSMIIFCAAIELKEQNQGSAKALLSLKPYKPAKHPRAAPDLQHGMHACRFDFPNEWSSLLSDLTHAAAWDTAATSVTGKERALFALKNVLRALRGRRIVVETPRPNGSMSPQGEAHH